MCRAYVPNPDWCDDDGVTSQVKEDGAGTGGGAVQDTGVRAMTMTTLMTTSPRRRTPTQALAGKTMTNTQAGKSKSSLG
jgi:hypothetical protein